MKTEKSNQQRYRLHSQIRKQGFELNTRLRTIYISVETTNLTRQIIRLRNIYQYAIQTYIPC
jgi:hypothetical protein